MSKVEVKKGDTWIVGIGGLFQSRDGMRRFVAHECVCAPGNWFEPLISAPTASLPAPAARAWIESLGGTVVEEREQEKPSTLVVKIYRSTHDGSLWMIDSPTHSAPSGYVFIGITTIHIAGVTT